MPKKNDKDKPKTTPEELQSPKAAVSLEGMLMRMAGALDRMADEIEELKDTVGDIDRAPGVRSTAGQD